jgi:predicted AlkP superfamily phosphohydrolase/phosphomutase
MVRGNKDRVLVIGLDGATFDLILPWVEQGLLPTIGQLLREGAWGKLFSTMRPESSVAWTSFMTGKNPGKHGVFGFSRYKPGSYTTALNNAARVKAATLWQILSHAGRTAVVLNLPMTYPPRPVRGAMVSGLMTPSLQSPFTYPPELKEELLEAVSGYMITAGSFQDDRADFISRVSDCAEKRKQAAFYLMERYDWDCFVVVFTGTDRVQHFLWADMDANHPMHDAGRAIPTAIQAHYRQLDDILAELLGSIGPDVHVLVMSDHGFAGYDKTLYMNGWLKEMGLIHFRTGQRYTARGLLRAIWRQLRSSRTLRALRKQVPLLQRAKTPEGIRRQNLADLVDWSKTRAFFTNEGGIRINLLGREPQGIVAPGEEYEALLDDIIASFADIRDEQTGFPIVQSVHRSRDLYSGPFASLAPDLIVETVCQGDQPSARNYGLGIRFPAIHRKKVGPAYPLTGTHTMDGILIARGAGIRQGMRLEGATIIDLAPTILHLMGLPVPEDMDGQVLQETFTEEYRIQHPVQFGPPAPLEPWSPGEDYEGEELEELGERLRGLGYLG